MSRIRRLLGWAVFVGFLWAVGFGVFQFVRYRPRCVITGPLVPRHLSADGSRLWTLNLEEGHKLRGPAQAWDAHSGVLLDKMVGDVEIRDDEDSNDGRYHAIGLRDGTLRIVDRHLGRDIAVEELPEVRLNGFSPKGRWLFAHARANSHFVVDVATGKVVLRLESRPFFSSDDRLLFTPKFAWDLEKNKKVPEIQVGESYSPTSPDGRWLLIPQGSALRPVADPNVGKEVALLAKARGVDVWDLTTLKLHFHRDLPRVGALRTAFSPDGRCLAMWLHDEEKESDLEMLDTATGKVLWSYPNMSGPHEQFCTFSPDSSLWAFSHDAGKEWPTVSMFDVATGRVLWERPGAARFVGDTGMVLHQDNSSKPPLFLDGRTGASMATLPPNFSTAGSPLLTPDGRQFLLYGVLQRKREYFWDAWLEKLLPDVFGDNLHGVLVMESATGRELFRFFKRERAGFILSDDASTLVSVERVEVPGDTVVIRVCDVLPSRSWLWSIGAAVATGLALLALRWAWRRRKARKAAASPISLPSIA